MKIKYDLQVFYNIVLFKVLEMDEKYRSRDGDKLLFTSSNGMVIKSLNCIELYNNQICVLGADITRDDICDIYKLKTHQQAQSYADKIRFALDEWNNHMEVMEIEWSDSEMSIKNEDYEVTYQYYVEDCSLTDSVAIFKGCHHIISYNITDFITLDKLIIMFNRDCELLNIPFRIKGEN